MYVVTDTKLLPMCPSDELPSQCVQISRDHTNKMHVCTHRVLVRLRTITADLCTVTHHCGNEESGSEYVLTNQNEHLQQGPHTQHDGHGVVGVGAKPVGGVGKQVPEGESEREWSC